MLKKLSADMNLGGAYRSEVRTLSKTWITAFWDVLPLYSLDM
jgi:hypothetical protein